MVYVCFITHSCKSCVYVWIKIDSITFESTGMSPGQMMGRNLGRREAKRRQQEQEQEGTQTDETEGYWCGLTQQTPLWQQTYKNELWFRRAFNWFPVFHREIDWFYILKPQCISKILVCNFFKYSKYYNLNFIKDILDSRCSLHS